MSPGSASGKWLVGLFNWCAVVSGLTILVLLHHLHYRLKVEEETLFSDLLSCVSCDHKAPIKPRFNWHLTETVPTCHLFHAGAHTWASSRCSVKVLLSLFLTFSLPITSFPHFSWCCLGYCYFVRSFLFAIHWPTFPLCFLCPPCPLSSVPSVFIESVVSSSAHPGGARAPSGGWDCECPAGPGPPQTPHHYDANRSRALWQHLDNAAATAHAQWALFENGVREESRILD